jgi:hypothetical protein
LPLAAARIVARWSAATVHVRVSGSFMARTLPAHYLHLSSLRRNHLHDLGKVVRAKAFAWRYLAH